MVDLTLIDDIWILLVWTISLIISFSLIIAYFVSRNFRTPPGGLILWEIIGIFIESFVFVCAQALELSTGMPPYGPWVILYALYDYALCIQATYLIWLSLEIYIVVTRPLNANFLTRSKIYHIGCQGFTISIVIISIIIWFEPPTDKTTWV